LKWSYLTTGFTLFIALQIKKAANKIIAPTVLTTFVELSETISSIDLKVWLSTELIAFTTKLDLLYVAIKICTSIIYNPFISSSPTLAAQQH
jgi:hypothetical protein